MNFALCIDLILMIKKPFQQKEALMNVYLICSILYSFFMTFILLRVWYFYFDVVLDIGMVLLWANNIIYISMVIFSIVYACIKLNQPGISYEIRKLVLMRHVTTMLGFLIVNSYILVGASIALFPAYRSPLKTPEISSPIVSVGKILFQMQGFLLPILRL